MIDIEEARQVMRVRETKEVILKNPVITGMWLSLGFFLMSIILGVIGWFILGLSCAAILSR